MGAVLGIVYRVIATHLVSKAGFSARTAWTGALTLIQRFGCALNLNLHCHMLFLDGVYTERAEGAVDLRWVKAPTSGELEGLCRTISRPAVSEQRRSLTSNGSVRYQQKTP